MSLAAQRLLEKGRAHHQQGRIAQAEACYRDALEREPRVAHAHRLLGIALAQQQRMGEAVEAFRAAVKRDSRDAAAQYGLGKALREAGRAEDAIEALRSAERLAGPSVDLHMELGLAHYARSDLENAEVSLRRALAASPGHPDVMSNLALVRMDRKDAASALALLESANQRAPRSAGILVNLGMALRKTGRTSEALVRYEEAVSLDPVNLRALVNLSNLLIDLGRYSEAEAMLARAFAIDPRNAEACIAESILAGLINDPARARAAARRAVAFSPDMAQAHTTLANICLANNLIEEAESEFRRAIELQPDNAPANSGLLFAMLHFPSVDPERVRQAHFSWGARLQADLRAAHGMDAGFAPAHDNRPDPERRLRIGYVSGDFRTHAVAMFIEPVIAGHDRERHEIVCYSSTHGEDGQTRRFIELADRFVRVADLPAGALADCIRHDGIDILIDLAGHTRGSRLDAFTLKPAPVQITWLGYPNTTGVPAMDYRITDSIADPPGVTDHLYSERLLRMPASLCCYVPGNDWPGVTPLPARVNGHITFGSLNSVTKIGPEVIGAWARLLEAVPDSRLAMFRVTDPDVRGRFLREFGARGIDPARIEFLPQLSQADFRRAIGGVDISLDTFPLVGGTTTCEALWMGVPVVSRAGATFLERVGASWLHSVGRAEWVAQSVDDYVDIAARLAGRVDELAGIRAGLRAGVAASPMADARRFTADFEALLRGAWRRWCEERAASGSAAR